MEVSGAATEGLDPEDAVPWLPVRANNARAAQRVLVPNGDGGLVVWYRIEHEVL